MCPLPALIKETESRKCRDNWQVPTINIQAKKKKKKGRKRKEFHLAVVTKAQWRLVGNRAKNGWSHTSPTFPDYSWGS